MYIEIANSWLSESAESKMNSDLPLQQWSLPATAALDLECLHVVLATLVWEKLQPSNTPITVLPTMYSVMTCATVHSWQATASLITQKDVP